MTAYAVDIQELANTVSAVLGDKLKHSVIDRGELTVEVGAADYVEACRLLRLVQPHFIGAELRRGSL